MGDILQRRNRVERCQKTFAYLLSVNGGDYKNTTADAGMALNVLLALSRYNKGQWRGLIEEWGIPVEIHRSDSVRDLVGRLLNYLEDHPDVAERIKSDSTKKTTKASPELAKVLSILLGKDKEEEEEKGAESKEKREKKAKS